MVNQLSAKFGDFLSEQKLENYCKAIEDFVNQGEESLKRFVFEVYASLGKGKINEKSLH